MRCSNNILPSLPSPTTSPLVFSHVSFAYPSNPTSRTLKDLNTKIFPGKPFKSTIVGLLQRFGSRPRVGSSSLPPSPTSDDKSHVMVNLNEILRSKLSLVSQSPQLFLTESIASKIRYGSNAELIPDEAVVEAAKAANAHEVVVGGRLKGGYEWGQMLPTAASSHFGRPTPRFCLITVWLYSAVFHALREHEIKS